MPLTWAVGPGYYIARPWRFSNLLAGVCLLVNKKARAAATSLGLTILLTVLWIYQPMLLAAPTDVGALNFFFDTLLFCGAILLLANLMRSVRRLGVEAIED